MFHINKILNRKPSSEKGAATPESPPYREVAGSLLEDVPSATEGFLCPACFSAFPTGTELQNHYESNHSGTVADATSAFICPACKMRLHSNLEFEAHFQRHHSPGQEKVDAENVHIQLLAMEEGKKILEKELDKIHNELLEKLRDIASGEALNTELKTKIGALEKSVEQLNSDREKLTAENKDLEQLLTDAKRKIDAQNIDIQQRPAEDDVNLLKSEIVSVQKKMDEMTLKCEKEKETIERKFSELKVSHQKLEEENLLLDEKLKTCSNNEDVERLQINIEKLFQENIEMHTSLSAGRKEIERLTSANKKIPAFAVELENVVKKYKTCQNHLSSTEKDLVKCNTELQKKEDEIQQLKNDRVKLFTKIEEGEGASAAIVQLNQENILLQERILQKQSENASALNDLNSKLESLNLENDCMKTKFDEKERKCKLLEHGLFSQMVKLKEINKEKLDFKIEIHEKKQHIESIMLQAQNIMNQLQKTAMDKDHLLNIMQSIALYYIKQMDLILKSPMEVSKYAPCPPSLENYSDMFYDYANKLNLTLLSKEKHIRTLTNTVEHDALEMTTLTGVLEDCKRTNTNQSVKINDLAKVKKDLVSENEKKVSEIAELKKNLELKEKRISELAMARKEVMEEKQLLLSNSTSLGIKIAELDDEINRLRIANNDLGEEKETLSQELNVMADSMAKLQHSHLSLNVSLLDLQKAMEEEKHNNDKAILDLEAAKDLLVKQTVEYQKEKEDLEAKYSMAVSELKDQIINDDLKYSKLLSDNDKMCTQLQTLGAQSLEKEQQWDKTLTHCKAQINLLTENTQTLKADLDTEHSLRSQVECRLDDANGNRLELEAKLENALDERKALLDRCLKCEADNEKLLEKNTELCRKLDDTVAALHELGRENQALQVENTRHLERKWTDDAEVDHCTACGKVFSVTIRKHHCRNCGNIFCNECSSKTATVAASKKPVRVCTLCHGELTK